MRNKRFALGLGVGILAVTLLAYFLYGYEKGVWQKRLDAASATETPELTDAEIIARARTLGMITQSEAAAAAETKTPAETATPAPAAAPAGTETPAPALTPAAAESSAPVETPSQTEPAAPASSEATSEAPQSSSDSLYIPPGMTSEQLSGLLFSLGLVDDAGAFNRYIISAGREKRIRVGVFSVQAGSEYEEILGIVTR